MINKLAISIQRLAIVLLALALAGATATGCRRQDVVASKPTPQIIWRTVGTESGRGNRQTESFTSDTGAIRIRWETRAVASAGSSGAARSDTFRLTAHSAISGRVLQQVVEEHGA